MIKPMLVCLSSIFLLNYNLSIYADNYDNLHQYGFELVQDNSEKLHLKFNNKNIIISKEKFKNSYSAAEFCKKQHLLPGGINSVFVFLLTGALDQYAFFRDSFIFDFSELDNPGYKNGIWTWSDKTSNAISLVYDGRGTIVDEFSLSVINEALRIEVMLPALCTERD